MDIKVFTIGCPACNVLEKKLNNIGVLYERITSEEEFNKLGIKDFPMMQITNGPLLSFKEAIAWVGIGTELLGGS